jgi:DNA-binding transcriptional LysR family regulator
MATNRRRRSIRHSVPAFDLELRQLRAFLALVENGSVTAASRTLHLAQSTVSEGIAALERALGTALIRHKRGTHTPELTSAGQVLLPHAREVLAGVDKACIAVSKTAVGARGSLHIVANESVSTYLLSGVLTTMRQHWPNTKFSVSVATCADIRAGLADGTFELGLLLEAVNRKTKSGAATSTSNRSDGRQVVAPHVPLVIFAAPGHPLVKPASRQGLPRYALDSFPLFVSDAAGDFHALLERFFREERLPGPRLESTGSIEGVKAGVLADPRGLGVLPSYAIAEELKTGRMARLELRPALPRMQLVALLSRSRTLHPSTIELLHEMSLRSATVPNTHG